MEEQTEVVEVRRRRGRAEIERLVGAYEASGLTRVEFCRKEGISLATLARYRKRRGHGEAVTGDR